MFFCIVENRKGENNIKNKKAFIILVTIVLFVISFTIFIKMNYKNTNTGNNKTNKTIDEWNEYIYNISSYDAEIEVTVESNKNSNKYVMKQKCTENESIMKIMEPENVRGVKITYRGNKVTVENTALNLTQIYENYPFVKDNRIFLSDFVFQYREKSEKTNIEEIEGNIIYTINLERETISLYVNEETGKPEKLIVQDNNKKAILYILYNKIEF